MGQHSSIDHTGLTGVSTLSFGSNSNSVAIANAPGSSPSNTRADHVHLGVTSIAHTSNTYSGPVTLTAGTNVAITSPSSGNYRIDASATAGGGGGLTHSTVGTTAAGASFATVRQVYMKKITLASAGLLSSIVAQVKGNANNSVALTAAVFSDNSGTPLEVIATSGSAQKESDNTSVTSMLLNTTTRAVAVPIGVWLAAGDYWIAVLTHAAVDGTIQLAYNAGTGTDRTRASFVFVDQAVLATTTTTNDYSIAAHILR